MSIKKILLIDDELSIIYSIKKSLEHVEYEIQSAQNGNEGIEKLKSFTPDLIIVDLMMPGMGGLEFIQEINLQPDDPYAVIVLTGHGSEDEMRKCYQLGAHFFVRKPFGITDLACLVDRCLTFKELEVKANEYKTYLEESVENQNSYISKLCMALDQSSTSVIMSDENRLINYINKSYMNTSGYALQDIKGRDFLTIFAPDNALLISDVNKHVDTGKSWEGDHCCLTKNGNTYWSTSSVIPIKDKSDLITNYIIIQNDITTKKEAEVEKEKSIILAEHHRQTKQSFSNNMSHELMTPIHIITTAASIFDSKISDETLKKYITYIKRASDDLHSRVTMILDFQRIATNNIQPVKRKFSIKKLFIDLLGVNHPNASIKNLHLDYTLDSNVTESFYSDEYLVMQILNYLLDNAIKFTEEGIIKLSAKTDHAKNTLIFEVTDTGIGIEDSKLEIIFDDFQQADGTTSRPYNGLGLGLTLARELAKILGGNIRVKSVVGKGSIFSLSLPLS